MFRSVFLLSAILLGWALAASATASEPDTSGELVISAGTFDLGHEEVGELGMEVRFGSFELPLGKRRIPLGLAVGWMVHGDGGYYFWSGLRRDWALDEQWRLTISLGSGIYSAGRGKNLGGPVEFRSSLEISRALTDRSRLSLNLYHLSNGILYDVNPGGESLVLGFHQRFGGSGSRP